MSEFKFELNHCLDMDALIQQYIQRTITEDNVIIHIKYGQELLKYMRIHKYKNEIKCNFQENSKYSTIELKYGTVKKEPTGFFGNSVNLLMIFERRKHEKSYHEIEKNVDIY